ncbi:MAG TPA: GyrI-like domain-containing protein [Humisphaera sp.]
MIDPPTITRTAARHTAVIPLNIPRAEIRSVMGPGLRELMRTIAEQGVAAAGPWFSHHRRMSPDRFDFEISVPVDRPVVAAGRVRPGEMPAMRVARTTYRGPYEGLGAAWGEFNAWLRAGGHAPAENLYECYVAGPEVGPDPSTWRTELNRPLVG